MPELANDAERILLIERLTAEYQTGYSDIKVINHGFYLGSLIQTLQDEKSRIELAYKFKDSISATPLWTLEILKTVFLYLMKSIMIKRNSFLFCDVFVMVTIQIHFIIWILSHIKKW